MLKTIKMLMHNLRELKVIILFASLALDKNKEIKTKQNIAGHWTNERALRPFVHEKKNDNIIVIHGFLLHILVLLKNLSKKISIFLF